MKKKIAAILLAFCTLAGCGNSEISTGNEPLSNAVYTDETLSLAPYTGLKAEKKIYRITDEALDNAVREQLSEFAEYESVTRASKEGDWVYADFTASDDGTLIRQETEYYFTIGEQEFGAEFDKNITGVKTGEQLEFSIAYDPDFEDGDLAGRTVDFTVDVTDVQEEILPELTDEFVKKNTDYGTCSEFTDSVRSSLEERYEAESTEELQEALLKQVIDASSILKYTQKEYDTAKQSIEDAYASYADMFGTDVDSLYETLEVTEDDVKNEIQTALYRTLVVQAIIKNENLSLSDEDYEDGVAYYMEQNGYESKDEFLNDYKEDEIRRQLLEDKVLAFLEEHADLTEIEAEYEDD